MIKNFKDIIEERGYSVSSKDREIFERDLSKSLFALDGTNWFRHGKTDVIEFILYDSNDNQLPQGDDGKYVRYIFLDDINIRKYFIVSDVPAQEKTNEARKYTVDTEKLINEAGYSNGIFKTQITLLNRRAGSEDIKFDKLWIHEISPSRTEIRVIPVKGKNDNVVVKDLEKRYNVFTEDKDFRDDTIVFVKQFIESINIQRVLENFMRIQGKVADGQSYIDLIKSEFKLQDFDIFLTKIKEKYIEAMTFYMRNYNYKVNSAEYGNQLTTDPDIALSVEEIKATAIEILHDIIDFMLPKRNILLNSMLSKEEQVTFDPLKEILKSTTTDSIYNSTLPESVQAIVRGCTDPNASNYNPLALENDGSCIYPVARESRVTRSTRGDAGTAVVRENTGTREDGTLRSNLNTTRTGSTRDGGESTATVRTNTGTRTNTTTTRTDSTRDLVESTATVRTNTVTRTNTTRTNTDRCSDPTAINYGQVGVCTYAPVTIREDSTILTYPSGGGSSYITEDYNTRNVRNYLTRIEQQ